MPILKPQIQEALRAAGLDSPKKAESSVSDSLDSAGLGLSETLETLEHLLVNGTEASRLRAAELAVKLRGLLKEQSAPLPSITISIKDSFGQPVENPILLPRELHLVR